MIAVALLAIAVAFSAGCAGGSAAPARLMDGSEASAPPVELEGVAGPAVLTNVRIVPHSYRGRNTRSTSCLERDWGVRPRGSSVERVGVSSESVTFAEESRRAIFGCDNSPGAREENRRWCGSAYGRLYEGHLRDPRLDIGGCKTADDGPIAFVWVEPDRGTRYIAVRQPGYAEVYEPAGDLPVRIASTSGLIADPLGATFEFSEHDALGERLRSRTVRAVPAG